MPNAQPRDITAGDKFPSPRAEEGIVRAVCDYGVCSHVPEGDRPEAVHVRSFKTGTEFFVTLPPTTGAYIENFHVCGDECDPQNWPVGIPCGEDDHAIELHDAANRNFH